MKEIIAGSLLILTAGCSASVTSSPADPYEVYLRTAPTDAPSISREDAQTRAFLGCGTEWAAGTVDAALAGAYQDLCDGER